MDLTMSLDCPFCMTAHIGFEVLLTHQTRREREPLGSDCYSYNDVVGRCMGCNRLVLAEFMSRRRGEWPPALNEVRGSLTEGLLPPFAEVTLQFVAKHPQSPKPQIPRHLPENVAGALLDAEKALHAGAFTAAAGSYRKAVDRAVTPLLPEGDRGGMLGQKLGALQRQERLPPAMIDWIEVVKDDGNFALHDDDRDFETTESVEPARLFARTLLTYLYTLPQQVRLDRARIEARETSIEPPEPG